MGTPHFTGENQKVTAIVARFMYALMPFFPLSLLCFDLLIMYVLLLSFHVFFVRIFCFAILLVRTVAALVFVFLYFWM